jgi:hypothetical protein
MSNAKCRHRRRRRLQWGLSHSVVLRLPVPPGGIPQLAIGSTLAELFEALEQTGKRDTNERTI